MTPQDMLDLPLPSRRGAITREAGSYTYLLVNEDPDTVLDTLIDGGLIGAAHRDCKKAVFADAVPRPLGSWGMLVRLKGHPWTYMLADNLNSVWPKQWAASNGWRVAWFSLDDLNRKIARLYDGHKDVFDFSCGPMHDPEPGFIVRKISKLDTVRIRGEAEVCSLQWLSKLASGGEAMDLLARVADAYLPVRLQHRSRDGKASVRGKDGEPEPVFKFQSESFSKSDFERVDVFTFGKPETLVPSAAAIALSGAVQAGDARAAQAALTDGADPNLMFDENRTPLSITLGLGAAYGSGERFAKVTRQQQLELMAVLLEAGANVDIGYGDPAIHVALKWAIGGDESTIMEQMQLLLDHGADPNAVGRTEETIGKRPLHVVAEFERWPNLLKLLVTRGADARLKNRDGQTARDIAEHEISSLRKSLSSDAAQIERNSASQTHPKKSAVESFFQNAVRKKMLKDENQTLELEKSAAFLADAENGRVNSSDIE